MGWGLVISSAASAGAQLMGGSAANKRAKRNAAGIFAQNTETIRRTLLSQQQTMGQTRAAAGSTGFSFDSTSIQSYLKEMQSNFDKNIDWLKKARDMGVQAELQAGKDAQTSAYVGALGSAAQGVGAYYSNPTVPKNPGAMSAM